MINLQFRKGTVESSVDELGLGRVRVRTVEDPNVVPTDQLPQMYSITPQGGGNNYDGAGFFAPPSVGQQVLIVYEQNNTQAPYIIGVIPAQEGGNKNPPIEAKDVSREGSALRIWRTRGGNTLDMLDTEVEDGRGIRLKSSIGHTLELRDLGYVRLGLNEAGNGEVYFTNKGFRLTSPSGIGIAGNDDIDTLALSSKDNKNKFVLLGSSGNALLATEAGFKLFTKVTEMNSTDSFTLTSRGPISLSSANINLTSTSDINLNSAGQNTNITASNVNIAVSTLADGGIDLRVPLGGTIDITNNANDITQALTSSLNFDVEGNINLSTGFAGGIYISNQFVSGIASGKYGGRNPNIPVFPFPSAAVAATPVGAVNPEAASGPPLSATFEKQPQPAVLGTNLHHLLSVLVNDLLAFLQTMTIAAPAFAMSPMGPAPLNPQVITQLAAFQTDLSALVTRLGTPNPQGILSSSVFIDG